MIVYGFPNRISALQFEHAWQHGYQTHFISPDERVVKHKNGGRSLKHRLATVRLLVKHQFFQRMSLRVHFFNKSTMECWNANEYGIDVGNVRLHISLNALEDIKTASNNISIDEVLTYAQENLDLVSKLYNDDKDTFQATLSYYNDILSNGFLKCDICNREFDYTSENVDLKPYIAFCLNHSTCNFHSHLSCLCQHFLSQSRNAKDDFIPVSGECPNCCELMVWPDIVKYSCELKAKYGL